MHSEQTIDDLMEQGWIILDASTDEAAYFKWQTQAVDCLTALLGPNHFYCTRLRNFLQEAGQRGLLAGTGILAAAREELARIQQDSCSRMDTEPVQPKHRHDRREDKRHQTKNGHKPKPVTI